MRTPLYELHKQLGGKMVEFAGWEMPIQYTDGILMEHKAVREHAGLFDVSHMGRIVVEGTDAEKFLDYLSTNRIAGKENNTAHYTVLCNEQGTCVDDVIIYKGDAKHFFLIVNAGNRNKDLKHLQKYASSFDVTVSDRFEEEGIICLQGPKALAIVHQLFPETVPLKKMQHITTTYYGTSLIIATTGYTGEEGVELYVPKKLLIPIWEAFLNAGAIPAGLGARDTLRLEMGYALYGHELSEAIYPHESVSFWTIKWKERDFVGKEAMLKRKTSSQKIQRGVALTEKGIPREGYSVHHRGKLIGKVTSGTFSPSLGKGIALVQLDTPLADGEEVEIEIRQHLAKGTLTPLPFYHKV